MRPSRRSVIAKAGIGVALLVFTASCSSDRVTAPAAPARVFTSLELTPSSFTLFTFDPLKTVQLSVLARSQSYPFVDGVRSFSSSDPDVATVDASGLVTAVAPGTADISVSVTIRGVTKTAATVVTVSASQIASAGQIAFVRPAVGIFLIKTDGSDLLQMTTGDDASPVWSADGSRLAFVHYERQGIGTQWVSSQPYLCVTGNGSLGPRCISTGFISRPEWSPDGSELAFISDTQAGKKALFATDLEHTRVITELNEPSGCEWGPRGGFATDVSWSSANRIAITYCNDIATLNPDGSGLQVLTRLVPNPQRPAENFAPTGVAWSPDGQSLAVAFEQTDCTSDDFYDDNCATVLGRLDANGTQFNLLVPLMKGSLDRPAWSPDGTNIVYAQHHSVWLIPADGSARETGQYDQVPALQRLLVTNGNSPSWGR